MKNKIAINTYLSTIESKDEGVGRYILPPRTTKRRTATNLKTKNIHNCQKIELYRSPTTKELKKKHSPRLVGRVEMGSQGGGNSQQGGGWRAGEGETAVGRSGGPTFVCR